MKKLLLLLSVPVAIAAFSGCSKSSSSAPATNASVMFVHGCASGTGTINLAAYDNGAAVNNASNLAFLANSGYQNIKAGSGISLSFSVTGLGGLDTGIVNLSVGSSYTAFAGGSVTKPTFVLASDDLSLPTAGYAKVRFVNLSPDGVNIQCYVNGAAVDSSLPPMSASSFYDVAATVSNVKIQAFEPLITNSAVIASQALAAGKIYTFMFTGTNGATTGSSALTLTAINNN